MTHTKSTKRALLMSGLALLLCVSMLVGSTFAWFTDSVTSSGNKIVAGTLDVQLLMYDGTEYADISNSSQPIFGAGSLAQNVNAQTLWEPGKTQVAYLAIKNNGSLALKYTVALDVENVSKDLYKVMQYTITPNAEAGEVTAWDATNAKSVIEGKQTVDANNIVTDPGATHYFALSIHMDEMAGNEYQAGEVNFDLTVLATQATVEADSFDNQYDVNASQPTSGTVHVPENTQTPTSVSSDNVTIQLPAASPAGAYTVRVSNKAETTNDQGQTVFSADIDLLRNGVKVESNGTTKYLVEIDIGFEKEIVEVLHKGQPIADFTYDASTGILSFETDSFSSFSVAYKVVRVVKVESTESFVEVLGTITEATTIDATGITLTPVDDVNTTIVIPAGATIKGANFAPNGSCWLLIGEGDQAVTFEDCTFVGQPLDQFKIATKGCTDITYTNCAFTGMVMINNCDTRDAVNTFNNCTFGLANGFIKCGYVNCMAATNIFNQCTFNYAGGSTMGSNQYVQWNAVNSYSENTNTQESSNYTTYVELNGCVRNGCGTHKTTANSTLVIN